MSSSQQNRTITPEQQKIASRLMERLQDDPAREGCVLWLADKYFRDEEVGEIHARLSAEFPALDFTIPGETRYLLVPFAEKDPEHGMAEILVRKGDKVTWVPGKNLSRQEAFNTPKLAPAEIDRLAYVGWARVFRMAAAGSRPRAERLFGARWERVIFVGWCRPANQRDRPDLPARVTFWAQSLAYLWLNKPARSKAHGKRLDAKGFARFAREVCDLLKCEVFREQHISGLLTVHVPEGWDVYQFTCAAMALQLENEAESKGKVFTRGPLYRSGATRDASKPWAVIDMDVDRLFEPLGRIPLVVRKSGLEDAAGNTLAKYVDGYGYLPDVYKRIHAKEAWEALGKQEREALAEVKVGVIDGAVWRHRDLWASRLESKNFCRHPSWNMPLDEHACRDDHGTICAGLIGATPPRNHKGLRGIAPGAKLFAARAFGARDREGRADASRPDGYWLLFFDENDGIDFNYNDIRSLTADPGALAEAIYWAAFEARCDVVLMSFEASESSPAPAKIDFSRLPPEADWSWGDPGVLAAVLAEAAKRGGKQRSDGTFRGCVLVAAAGNTGSVSSVYDQMVLPAVHPDVMRVGATSSARVLSTGWTCVGDEVVEETETVGSKYLDNEGKVALSIAAPGRDLVSISHPFVLREGGKTPSQQFYTFGAATSDAAPLVAGAAALLFAIKDELSAENVRDILECTARDEAPVSIYRDPQWPEVQADFGELDVAAACAAARRHPAP